jgi:hypothetical protein
MKKIILALFLIGASAQAQQKQNVKYDPKTGNFYAIKAQRDTATQTGRFYVESEGKNAAMLPIWKSKRGKLFVLKMSKSGIQYKFYLKPGTDSLDWEGN